MDSIHIVYNIYLPYEKFINIPNLILNFDSNYIYHYPGILSQYTRPCYSKTLVYNGNSSIENIEKKYGILLFHPFFLSNWKLYFSGKNEQGKLHYDRQRCFGTTFRILKTIKNTSNYTILINDEIFTPTIDEYIIINNDLLHKPLDMDYGERILEIYDYNTSFDTIVGSLLVMVTLLYKRITKINI